MLVVIKFRIRRLPRFLSHAETIRLFLRACVRAGIRLQHSHGFNPHPKLSLPLPRSVGIETDCDLLCLGVEPPEMSLPFDDNPSGQHPAPEDQIARAAAFARQITMMLARQLPDGCELLDAEVPPRNSSFEPLAATYRLALLRPEQGLQELCRILTDRIDRLLSSPSLELERYKKPTGPPRHIDVRPFLQSIELSGNDIMVDCVITPAGSIRIDEILSLLNLDITRLASPVRRTAVSWQQRN